MKTTFIGDFRGRQLQNYRGKLVQGLIGIENNFVFFMDNNADADWFETIVLPALTVDSQSNIIVMSGFIDCIYSIIFNYNITDVYKKYENCFSRIINELPGSKLYICSVNFIDEDYYYSILATTSIKINKNILNNVIEAFNKNLNDFCTKNNIIYIDSYNYLKNIDCKTHDGVRFNIDTCVDLFNYIISHLDQVSYNSFPLRDSEDRKPKTTDPEYIYWINERYTHNGQKGLNIYSTVAELNGKGSECTGSVLPNCTGYAWGRLYEILEDKPNIPRDSAQNWYDSNHDYDKGGPDDSPRPGAVMCWTAKDKSIGHVAIVEAVNPDGSVIVSESGFDSPNMKFVRVRYPEPNLSWKWQAKSDWIQAWNYDFQGFIYCPLEAGTGSITIISGNKSELFTGNEYINQGTITPKLDRKEHLPALNAKVTDYSYSSSKAVETKMKPNAQYIWNYLGQAGWSRNAVAAMLGNFHQESNLSPEMWQGNIAGSKIADDGFTRELTEEASGGYGLAQWTSYTKLTNWCKEVNLDFWDIDSQLKRILWELENNKQWSSSKVTYKYEDETFKGLSFKEFTKSNKRAGWLAAAWAYCYEKPGASTSDDARVKLCLCLQRDLFATYWYDYLCTLPSPRANLDLYLSNFRITNFENDNSKVNFSFLTRNCKNVTYKLFKGNIIEDENKPLFTGTIFELKDKEILEEKNTKGDKIPECKTFSVNGLIPNTEYCIKIYAIGTYNEQNGNLLLKFKTPQSYPESATNLKLDLLTEAFPKGTFNISFDSPKSWGYWKEKENNDFGYEVSLLVNNKSVKTFEHKGDLEDFNLLKYFKKEYEQFKLGDTIQIGIRTWVAYKDNEKLYDKEYLTTSNPICLLKKPVIAYLNV